MLGGFAQAHLETFDAPMLTRFEDLLQRSDSEIVAWIVGAEPTPSDVDADLVAKIAAHRRPAATP